MTADQWARITAIFEAAVEKSPSERSAFLDQACGGDASLRRNVERLLAADSEPSLASPISEFLKSGALEPVAGETLAQYRIEGKIGEGGMGAVYRGYDTRLQRKVALKLLAADRFADEERKRRLLREARAASALNHPNIVTVYEIGSDRETDFIAMEYVEGRRLDQLIPPKGMPASALTRYAIQIADALAKAHAAGILHRDLKPSNIMVNEEDRIKVLDFGLAKILEPAQRSVDASGSSVRDVTEEGVILGTPFYMSPEQAEGRKLDARSDIFSFGSVLYEMATGQRPFTGDSRLSVMSRILNNDPQPAGQLASLPSELDQLILRCLRKDPARRYQTMADLRAALEDLRAESSATSTPERAVRRPSMIRKLALSAVAICVLAALVFAAFRIFRPSSDAAPRRTVKFTITPNKLGRGADTDVDAEVSISPDGKHITYVEAAGGQLWIRDLDQEQAHIVPGATRVYQVFWSPDSQTIGYTIGRRDLMRIPIQGGTPTPICKLAGNFRRASWSQDGETIVYCDDYGMYTVPAHGGNSTRIIEHSHIEHPSFVELPSGRRAVLFQTGDEQPGKHGIYIQVLGQDKRRSIAMSSSTNPYPAYSPSGHIIYVDGQGESSSIWALPFSLKTLQETGKPFPVAQHGSSPQVSRTDTLVYSDVPSNRQQLVWYDRSGKRLSTVGEPQRIFWTALSRDGRKLAVEMNDNTPDLWVYDLESGSKTRVTSDSAVESSGAWSPSGGEIAYRRVGQQGKSEFLSKPSNGFGEAKQLVEGQAVGQALEWSPDQKYLIYESFSRDTKRDLLYRERRSDGTLGSEVPFLKTPFDEGVPRFSPDGRFVAYMSNEAGQYDIYVRDFPGGKNKWQISSENAGSPYWRRDGKELYYNTFKGIVAVPVSLTTTFASGPHVSLPIPIRASYEPSPDGKRFLVRERPQNEPPLSIHIVHNWFEEFRN